MAENGGQWERVVVTAVTLKRLSHEEMDAFVQ